MTAFQQGGYVIHVVSLFYVDERDFEHFRLCDEELGHASTTKVLAVLAERKTI